MHCNSTLVVPCSSLLEEALSTCADAPSTESLLRHVGSGYSVYRSAAFPNAGALRKATSALTEHHDAVLQRVCAQAEAAGLDTAQVRVLIGGRKPLVNLGAPVPDPHLYMVLWTPVPEAERIASTSSASETTDGSGSGSGDDSSTTMMMMTVGDLLAASPDQAAAAQRARDAFAAGIANEAARTKDGQCLFPRDPDEAVASPGMCNPTFSSAATYAVTSKRADSTHATIHLGVSRLGDAEDAATMFLSPFDGALLLEKRLGSSVWSGNGNGQQHAATAAAQQQQHQGCRMLPVDALRHDDNDTKATVPEEEEVAVKGKKHHHHPRAPAAQHFQAGATATAGETMGNPWRSAHLRREAYSPTSTITSSAHVDSIIHGDVTATVVAPAFCALPRQTAHERLMAPTNIQELQELLDAVELPPATAATEEGEQQAAAATAAARALCLHDCEGVRNLLLELDPDRLPFTYMNQHTAVRRSGDRKLCGWRLDAAVAERAVAQATKEKEEAEQRRSEDEGGGGGR